MTPSSGDQNKRNYRAARDAEPRVFRTASIAASAMLVAAACSASDVEPGGIFGTAGPPPQNQDAGSDGADDTAGGSDPQRVCAVYAGEDQLVEGETYRWHCTGISQVNIKAKIDFDVSLAPDDVEAGVVATLDQLENTGLGGQKNFGPGFGASFDDSAVVACCETEYDYPNTAQPNEDDAEHGWACTVDCLDQACRSVPDELRDFANGEYKTLMKITPLGCNVTSKICYYDQVSNLANFVAAN